MEKAVRDADVVIAEVGVWANMLDPDEYVRLVRAVDRKAFAVHMDPVNLVKSPRRSVANVRAISEYFEKRGRWS